MKCVPGYEYRLNFALDIRVALEALLVQRLKQQPNTRQHEWLRRLLVLGFREECRTLRNSTDKSVDTAFSRTPTQRSIQRASHKIPAVEPEQPVVSVGAGNGKPLAALRKVLGDKVA